MPDGKQIDTPLTFTIGRDEIVIRRRYEFASIANDFLIAIWFLAGSILFLYPAMESLGSWFFIFGSVQFLVRPSIRLVSHIHLKRLPASQWEN